MSLKRVLIAKKIEYKLRDTVGDPGVKRKSKTAEQMLHEVLYSPSENKCPGTLVSKVIFQAFCSLFKYCGRPLNPV